MKAKSALLAYCGLYCGDCFSKKGDIPDLARDLRKLLRKYKFGKIAKVIPLLPNAASERNSKAVGSVISLKFAKN